jgi:hypothetical protein
MCYMYCPLYRPSFVTQSNENYDTSYGTHFVVFSIPYYFPSVSQNIFLSTLFSNTTNLLSSYLQTNIRNHVQQQQ